MLIRSIFKKFIAYFQTISIQKKFLLFGFFVVSFFQNNIEASEKKNQKVIPKIILEEQIKKETNQGSNKDKKIEQIGEIFILLERHPEFQNKKIKWKQYSFPLKKNIKTGENYIELEWIFESKDTQLIMNGNKLEPQTNTENQTIQSYKTDVPIKIELLPVELDLLEVGPTGEVSKEKFKITTINTKKEINQKSITKKMPFLSFSMGGTYLTHSESGYSGLSQFALSGKLNIGSQIGESPFDIGGNIFSNFLGISSPSTDFIKFIGSNIRMGYSLFKASSPFGLNLMVGAYYITTFSQDNIIGFKNMMGPQVFPSFRYTFNTGSLGTYFKYSPISQGILPTFQSREIATGLNLATSILKFPVTTSFDYSNLFCSFENGILQMSTHSYTLSVGIGF